MESSFLATYFVQTPSVVGPEISDKGSNVYDGGALTKAMTKPRSTARINFNNSWGIVFMACFGPTAVERF